MMITQNSHFIPFENDQVLHLRHIYNPENKGDAVFFLHGAVENGKIFYTESNKGLAPFLAAQGYQCFVADLRGRGQSLPKISSSSQYGQTEAILEDIPTMLNFVKAQTGHFPKFWVAHSWGGVLLNSYLARYPEHKEYVSACGYFGTKRSLFNNHPSKLLQANLIWYTLAPLLSKRKGYLDARKLKWGSDNETVKSHYQSMQWAKKKPWIDSDDGFDYASAIENISLPPILHIAGTKDKALAQPIDIQAFIEESGKGIQDLRIYGKKYGHKIDYDHINMLTSPHAHSDQFKELLDWFAQHRA
ncbi:alpha/beta fold hydrolase [Pseudoalteromonas sp. SS15]|uniref:alpha/beta fold hydrolase n=1 Tax=Pseudoalteromonas sp. SS15 TaxID=3139393 RepID=UPI003BA9A722